MAKVRLLADENIALLSHYFSEVATIETFAKGKLTASQLHWAEALLVRSTCQVSKSLLAGSTVRFVGSAVTGLEHLDTAGLAALGITLYAAQGCNALAVLAYVQQVVDLLIAQQRLPKQGVAAVIGAGRIGQLVTKDLQKRGFRVLTCDPLRQQEASFVHTPLADIAGVDLITVHTPLTSIAPYATSNMLTPAFLLQQKRGCVLLNAGRGEVLAQSCLEQSWPLTLCLDVWPAEPDLKPAWLEQVWLATPHIAGHTPLGLGQGTDWVYRAFCTFFQLPLTKTLPLAWQANRHSDLAQLSTHFKQQLQLAENKAQCFQQLRKSYGQQLISSVCQ